MDVMQARGARLPQPAEAAGERTWLAVVAGALGAIGAASCCVVPFLLFTLGVSGAWIGNLTALAPYQPLFLAAAAAFLAFGFVRVYRRPRQACADGSYCARPTSRRSLKVGLWAATGLVALAAAFPFIAPLFLDV